MRCIALFVCLFSFAWAAPVRAESGPLSLSLSEALSRAEAASPLVRRAAFDTRVVEARKVGASLAMPSNPILAVALGKRFDRSGSVPPAEGFEWGLHLEQAFEIGGQRGARVAEVERAAEVAKARERLARVETGALVRTAYVSALLYGAHVDAARRREELSARVLESIRSRQGAGAASDVDVRLAESERGRAAQDRLEAEVLLSESESELTRLLDFPAATRLSLTTALDVPPESASLDGLVAAARRRREELRVLGATEGALAATRTRLRREIVPTPSVFADLSQATPGQTYVGGGASVAVPLFRRNQGEHALVKAERQRVAEEQRVVTREIEGEVTRMFRGLLLRREEARLFTEEVVPAAEANLALVTEGFRAGKFDVFRVVQVARDAADARRRQLEVLASLWQVAIDLGRATGAP
jgi:cobalt-zinc-cadmium efflux system outer membrane protein